MDIQFENKAVNTYREVYHQVRRIQETAESVVPDTNDDIGRIISVHSSLLLKSKDVSTRGVTVSGEMTASLMYVTEDENAVSFVKMSKAFTVDFEAEGIESDKLVQVNMYIANSEARILNPRKVSVTAEIAVQLSCYALDSMDVETQLPEESIKGFHARFETVEAVAASSVCEKTFAVNEQFAFPGGKPAPMRIASFRPDFSVSETQHIGAKIIVKGNVNIELCYISAEVNYPLQISFTAPFSQIVDAGTEAMDSCTVMPELTSCYYDIIDTISGEKALDVELHAVVQLVCRSKQKIKFISDAYSNLMPAKCCVEACQLNSVSDMLKAKLSGDERICVDEDCSDVLSVFAEALRPQFENGKLRTQINLDVVYKNKDGALATVKRQMNLEGDCLAIPSRMLRHRISDLYLRPDGAFIDAHISVELVYHSCSGKEIMRVCAVSIDEENAYECEKFPSLTLVKTEEESLWELAKKYHSSIECIERMNDTETKSNGNLLLIPREI